MGVRTLRTVWVTRKSIDSGFHPPEMALAWDEWDVDDNPEGWQEAVQGALDSLGDDLHTHRLIDIAVHEDAVNAPFDVTTVAGRVPSKGRCPDSKCSMEAGQR